MQAPGKGSSMAYKVNGAPEVDCTTPPRPHPQLPSIPTRVLLCSNIIRRRLCLSIDPPTRTRR